MGKSDFCCVYKCSRQRDREKGKGGVSSFYQIPLGKSKKAAQRRKLWLNALRRENFEPTKNSKVCDRHFVSGMAINDPCSTDYVPTLHLGYGNNITARRTATSTKRACYWSDEKLSSWTDSHQKAQMAGVVPPFAAAYVVVDDTDCHPEYTQQISSILDLPQAAKETSWLLGPDHDYCTPSAAAPVHLQEEPVSASTVQDYDRSVVDNLRMEVMELKQCLDSAHRQLGDKNILIHQQEEQILDLQEQVSQLEDKLKTVSFEPDTFLTADETVQFYAGIKNKNIFDALFKHLEPKAARMHYWRGDNVDYMQTKSRTGKKRGLTLKHEFTAVMIRLKLGLFVNDLSARLGISSAHFSRMFTSWIRFLRLELQGLCRFPSRFEVRHFMPPESQKYSNLRCIIDCTEFFTETPSSLISQRQTWSSYKQHNTAKVLIACTPDGVLCYISKVYGGAVSDKHITTTSGFLDFLHPGDIVLADKGFDVKTEVEMRGATLNLPPFLNPGQKQFSAEEVVQTRQIAEVRIHVERLIGRIKCFHILDGTIPLTLHPLLEDIVHTCAYLTQFQTPIIASKTT